MDIEQEFDIPCLNYSDSKIGDEMIKKYYCQEKNIDIQRTSKERNISERILAVKNCIASYVHFKHLSYKSFSRRLRRCLLVCKMISKRKYISIIMYIHL